jgi:hypothetical protein
MSDTKENKRKRGRPRKPPEIPTTEGQRQLIEEPSSDVLIAEKLECGSAVVGHWRRGRRLPGPTFRRKLELLFGIPQRAWDVEPGAPIPSKPPPSAGEPKKRRKADDDKDTLTITKDQIDAVLSELEGQTMTETASARLRDTMSKLLALRSRLERDRDLLEDRVVREHPEWLRTKAAILKALKPYPDAAKAVAEALKQA